MFLLPKNSHGCPFLFLAPMEGVGDPSFRMAMAAIGGFDQAVTEFIRVPLNAHIKSLAKNYDSKELTPIPLAAQIMGTDINLMAEMAVELERKGAPRIDLNCGCPSNTVTGKGAGSSLLKTPHHLHDIAKAMCKAVKTPVTIKMRSGYEDTSLFQENLLAAQESGVSFITLHPRTKEDGYGPPAKWELIAQAKSLLKIPVVGNGDILTVQDAIRMLEMTSCDALMIGRGAVINPFIFQEIKAHFEKKDFKPEWDSMTRYFDAFLSKIPETVPPKNRISKFKQLFGFLFKGHAELLSKRQEMLTQKYDDLNRMLEVNLGHIKEAYFS